MFFQEKSSGDWARMLEFLETILPGTVGMDSRKYRNNLEIESAQDWERSEPVKFGVCNMSDGTLRALKLLDAVFQKPAPSVLVIECPELTIHPGALGAVLDLL